MKQSELPVFADLLACLERFYRSELSADTAAEYFARLAAYPLAIVEEVVDNAPGEFPGEFPSCEQLAEQCHTLWQLRDAARRDQDAQLRTMKGCRHEYRFEADATGPYAGFRVCRCGHSLPVRRQHQEAA